MRLVIAALAFMASGGIVTPGPGPGPGHYDQFGGWKTLWYVPLTTNGISAAANLPSGFTTPAIIWVGWSPLVNYGSAGGTFTATGAPTTAYSPFCPDGDFSDLTDSGAPSTNSCLQAREFDGTTYYTFSGTAGDINSTHISACVIYRPDATDADIEQIIGTRDDTSSDGWAIRYQGTVGQSFYIETAGANASRAGAGIISGYWSIQCGTAASGGNMYSYNNGTTSAATGYPAGVATSATAFRVGTAATTAGLVNFDGAILAAYVWPGTTLTAANVRQFEQYWAGILPSGEFTADTTTTAGNACYWYGSKMSCLSDDLTPIGGAIPPGLTGAGAYGGLVNYPSTINRILQSRDPTASWAVTGTLLGATSTANSPFLNGWAVTLLEDDDGAGAEYMAQGIDMTALNTGDHVLVMVYARSGTGTKGIDLRLYEDVGGGCTTAQTDYPAVAVTTAWTTAFAVDYTITDGDCTSFIVYTGPVSGAHPADFADVTQVGDVYALYQVFFSVKTAYPVYIETTTAQATAGAPAVQWLNNTNAAVVQPAASSTDKVTFTMTPVTSTPYTSASAFYMYQIDDGSNTNYTAMTVTTGGAANWRSQAGSSVPSYSPTFVGGTALKFMSVANWGSDSYTVWENDVLKDTKTTAEAPATGMDSITIGSRVNIYNQAQGAFIKEFSIKRKR